MMICSGPGKARIVMRKPFDMHQHLRQGALLRMTAPLVAERFAGAVIMPNTTPAITEIDMVEKYRSEIYDTGISPNFMALMTMYLTDGLLPWTVARALEKKYIVGVKYYPRGLTTNSDSGVENPSSLWTRGTKPYEVLRALADNRGILLLHAADGIDVRGEELDPYDQEKHFVTHTLPEIIEAHPDLKISVEHLSTTLGAHFIERFGGERLGCSITAHHLLLDRRDVFRGGFRTHKHWWPIIQPKEHKEALRKLVSKGYPFVWLGSDSAPHPVGKKESSCCIGGVLMAHAGIELYAEALEDIGCLDKLEQFASINGPAFFGIVPSKQWIMLLREEWKVERMFVAYEGDVNKRSEDVVPFRLGESVRWKFMGAT